MCAHSITEAFNQSFPALLFSAVVLTFGFLGEIPKVSIYLAVLSFGAVCCAGQGDFNSSVCG